MNTLCAKCSANRKGGYSLIELMLVVALSVLLIGLTISTFAGFSNMQSLDKDIEAIAGYIQKAKNQTINSKNSNEFGINIASTTVTIFEGTTYSPSASSNIKYQISPKVYLFSNQMKTNNAVVNNFYFQQITGKPTATGTLIYKLYNDASSTRSITLYGSGLVETQ